LSIRVCTSIHANIEYQLCLHKNKHATIKQKHAYKYEAQHANTIHNMLTQYTTC